MKVIRTSSQTFQNVYVFKHRNKTYEGLVSKGLLHTILLDCYTSACPIKDFKLFISCNNALKRFLEKK